MAFIAGPVPESFERRVTATPQEFARDLRQAWPAVVADADGLRFSLHEGAQELEEESHQEGGDMHSVRIRVGKDYHLPVAKLLQADILAQAASQRRD